MKNTIKILNKKALFVLLCAAAVGAAPFDRAFSLDTDIYFSNPSATQQAIKPNVLVIIDTSYSMNSIVNDGQGKSRLTHMKEAMNTILDNTQNVNMGLMRFSSDPGGPVLFPIADLDATASSIEGNTVTVQSQVGASSDDAEQLVSNGAVILDNATLTMVKTVTNNQVVGLRFSNVVVPRKATITNAFIRFEAANSNSAATYPTSLTIKAQKSSNPGTFTTATNDVGNRTTGANAAAASVAWNSVPDWISGKTYTTPNLTSIVQELVDQSTWCGGNSMLFTISGTGTRIAASFDSSSGDSPVLVVQYTLDPARTGNTACVQKSVQVKVTNDADDAQENTKNGGMTLGSSTLDLGVNSSGSPTSKRLTGIRFASVSIPPGATIVSANIDFTDQGSGSGNPSIDIVGQKTPTPGSFTTANLNISSRVDTAAERTASTVTWTNISDPSAFSTVSTPDISPIVQELVNQTGWADGNPMLFVFTPTTNSGYRIVEARERTFSDNPAVLRVVYQVNATSNASNDSVRLRLKQIVSGLVAPIGALTPIVDTLYEAGLYYRGQPVLYGRQRGPGFGANARYTRVSHPATYTGGLVFRDFGCTDTNLNDPACETEFIDDSSSGAPPVYKSPFQDGCQNNYIILLTDGDPTVNNSKDAIQSLIGKSCVDRGDGTCGPELLSYYFGTDLSSKNELQNIKTYTIGFASDGDPQYLKDLARAGGTSGTNDNNGFKTANNASELVTAFQQIFSEVISDPTSFVSPSLSVNAFNKLFNRDEVYFSLFSPQKEVAWPGNVKKFKLCADPTNATCTFGDVLDANNADAIDINSKIKLNARSIWSTITDGPIVKLGGAGENVPTSSSRKVYTYNSTTDVPSSAIDLSVDPHVVNNTNITKTQLGDSAMTDARRDNIINWMRGLNVMNEPAPNGTIPADRWKFGDALHSRPLTITYGGTDADPVIKIFVGTNDGGLRMIDAETGKEEWIVYIPEFLPKEGSLMDDGQGTHITQLTLGLDGTPSGYAIDTNGNGVIEPAQGDKVYVYIGERRGGRDIYAFDVTPTTTMSTKGTPSIGLVKPKFLWRIKGGSANFVRLGQTWSRPLLAKIRVKCNGTACSDGDSTTTDSDVMNVLIFGGGYDPRLDTPGAGNVVPTSPDADTMGNAIYIVNPLTGALVWWAGGTGSGANLELAAMKYAIPSDLALVDTDHDGAVDRLYVGDTRGQLFRIDLGDQIDPGSPGTGGSKGYVFADVGCQGSTRATNCSGTPSDARRKFFYPPDVAQVRDSVYSTNPEYDLVTITSGDREDPLDKLTGAISGSDPVHNRLYAFRDYNVTTGPLSTAPAALTESNLYDATDNKLGTYTDTTLTNEINTYVKNSSGWYISFKESNQTPTWIGEKGLAKTVIFGGVLFATTFVPSADDGNQSNSACAPLAEGIGRVYAINYLNGTPAYDFDNDGTMERSMKVGGGIPSETVIVIREGGVTTLIGTSGGAASPDIKLNLPRYQTYWYED
ncbi:MAG: VWA domain-containing protein [Sulfurifustis sp.]